MYVSLWLKSYSISTIKSKILGDQSQQNLNNLMKLTNSACKILRGLSSIKILLESEAALDENFKFTNGN